ncbi:MAG: FAD-binding oxidoreductase [Clostridiales bacterium]|nr:FAD-binding oxidoreductase [Clostridiales bacterium]
MTKVDVAIIGGGVIGASIAWHLLELKPDLAVAIIEKDPSYQESSTPRSAGGIRRLFTKEVHIRLSQYSLEIYRNFSRTLGQEISFRPYGYLFLARKESWPSLKAAHDLQRSLGVTAELLSPAQIREIIPELKVDDLEGGLYGRGDGYMDPYAVMQGYLRRAKEKGALYLEDEATSFVLEGGSIRGVGLASGKEIQASAVVNAGGAWGADLSRRMGYPLPVVPLPRQVFVLQPGIPFQNHLPLTIDPTGVYFREEGQKIIAGYSEEREPSFELTWDPRFFEEHIWPVLAERAPNLEALRLERGWAGIYDDHIHDHSALLGPHPELQGYYVALGFSGHGLQHAPAVGIGMAEWILRGAPQTVDLTPLTVERLWTKNWVREEAIV